MAQNEKDPIDSLAAGMFRQVRCKGMDALTVFIPEGQEPSPQVQKYVDEAGSARWYPQYGGHLVKIPNVFKSYDAELFQIEKNGWNHEHCAKCGETINANDECWMAKDNDNNSYLFCDNCHWKLKRQESQG